MVVDAEPKTMGELREYLIEKATIDETFRAQFIADPKAAIEDELGVTLPAGFTIRVHEEAADMSHVVLPPLSELAEAELETASGGYVKKWNASLGRYQTQDSAISFWDDFNPTYQGGPRNNV